MEDHNNLPQRKETAEIQKKVQSECLKSFKATSKKIAKSDLKLYNQDPNTLESYSNPLSLVRDVKETIEKICVLHFGVRSGLLDEVLIESVVSTIILKFKTLTTHDLGSAFERVEVDRNNWKNITKRDLIEPIQNWWNKKEEIRLEFEKYKRDVQEAEQAEQKEHKFYNDSINIYRQSLVSANWEGSIFQASSIAKDVAKHIDQIQKNELWQQAQRKKRSQDKAFKEDPTKIIFDNIGLTEVRLYSELIVQYGIKNKIEI